MKNLNHVIGIPAQFQVGELPDLSLERYRHTDLLRDEGIASACGESLIVNSLQDNLSGV
jgi:hypothetical protein